MFKQLKIAYVTSQDPSDRRPWSGIYYSMLTALRKHWGEACWVGPLEGGGLFLGKVFNALSQKILHKRYNYQHSLLTSLDNGKKLARKLSTGNFDLIFAPAASTEIACLATKIPIVYVADASFALVNEYYAVYSNLLKISIKEGNWIEHAALTKSSIVLFSSDWAMQSAIGCYHVDPSKLFIVPFGANIAEVPSRDLVLKKPRTGQCRLLFLGVDWERKGGPIAFDALLHLERMGVDAQLTVCGCVPPASFMHPKMRTIPFLDKSDDRKRASLRELFMDSDFLLLPTRAEGFGIVFCEANAFGLPAITTNTGGVPGAITDGENGYMLPLSAGGEAYAKLIADIFRDDRRYDDLAKSSREHYEKRLNWDAWAIRARKLIFENLHI